jgi:Ca-activated chloride channel family protein
MEAPAMRFEYPLVLWLLLVIAPAMVLFFWQANKKRQALLSKFIQARLLPGLLSGVSPARRRIREALLIVAISSLVIALARPQWGFTWEEVQQRGLDIVAAIDTSKSMLAEDISPNRLQRAKLAAQDLMQAAKTDRLGLVAFAGVAFLQCPLTIDDTAFRQSLDTLDVNIMPQGGTALAEAINEALQAFGDENNYRVLVLFTDGEDHDSGALEAAQKAAEKGLRIFTVGIGSPEGEVLRVRDNSGRTDYIKDDQGNAVKSRLNEPLLKEIAAAAKGFYLPLEGARTIETLYERGIAPLPRSEGKEKLVKRYHERYHWPLGLAIVLLLAEILIPERPRERAGASGWRNAPLVALLLGCLLVPISEVRASSGSALREYRAGNYDAALQEYQRLQKKEPDPRLNYNAGVAAYRDGQLEEAARQFGQALSAQDLELQEKAYFNRGNTHYYMGEAAQEPQKKTQAWEQAIKDFQSSLKLNPNATDAQFNHEFVKRRLEELKQQQQQQQQDQNNQQNQDQNQQQQQSQGQNQDQKQSQEQQKSGEQNQRPQQQPGQEQQKKPDEQQQQQSAQSQPDAEEKKESQPTGEAAEKEPTEEQASEQPADGKMSKAEARRLMDAQKGDEQMLPMPMDRKNQNERRSRKDW